MKIYFDDGYLNDRNLLPFHCDHIINAKAGYLENVEALDKIRKYCPKNTVYTNSLVALSTEYCWNEDLQVPELYIRQRKDDDFVRIDQLTTRELRQGHNLLKMYMSNEFGNFNIDIQDKHINDKEFNPFYDSDFFISREGSDERRMLVELYEDELIQLRTEIDEILKNFGKNNAAEPIRVTDLISRATAISEQSKSLADDLGKVKDTFGKE